MTQTPAHRLIDGHLDLALGALEGRDPALSLDELRRLPLFTGVPGEAPQTPSVTFGELQAAGLGLCFGTLFARKGGAWPYTPGGYTDTEGARQEALRSLDWYHRWQDAGLIRLLPNRTALMAHLNDWEAGADLPLGVALLMEGADPVRGADDLPFWAEQGVRLIGPAWRGTRYAGGTGEPGGLTEAGHALLQAMADLNLTLDASHLDDAAFWDALPYGTRVIATHSNARHFIDSNRLLSDDMIRAIGERGGVVGVVPANFFIRAGWRTGQERVPLQELSEHARHIAGLIGWERVALGSDFDGGFGTEQLPAGLERYPDLHQLAQTLPAEHRAGFLWDNWARWLREHY
ncbi:hypothetical protein GCM10017783_09200 [Deinococcus piscis]|uniref:Peptidase M19 n=1 Tax=Deinococcus piscis TaxID=394230 RepID=A0ABQ3K2P3_9DEIO|nr:membrane dipeptidase [Deinococcus piscis]GHF99350.1 hypothetical protein GCM10017783_09200 [Deinococcus piscis]